MTRSNIMYFLLGAGIAGTSIYIIMNKKIKKYEEMMKEYEEIIKEDTKEDIKEDIKEDTKNYEEILTSYKEDEINEDELDKLRKEEDGFITEVYEKPKKNKPYVIATSSLGETDNEIEYYYYLADGNVLDDNDNLVSEKEIKNLFGSSLKYFTNFTEEVCVRNDNNKKDYQILRSEKTYSDIINSFDM